MDIYDKALYLLISSILGAFVILFLCAMYWRHERDMFELQLKYKYLERNETINDKMPKV